MISKILSMLTMISYIYAHRAVLSMKNCPVLMSALNICERRPICEMDNAWWKESSTYEMTSRAYPVCR